MSEKSRFILQSIKESRGFVKDGLPPEVFAQFIEEDDPFRESILGDKYGSRIA